jgi:hypothetical protein
MIGNNIICAITCSSFPIYAPKLSSLGLFVIVLQALIVSFECDITFAASERFERFAILIIRFVTVSVLVIHPR